MMSLRDKDSRYDTKQEVGGGRGGSEASNKAIVANSSSGSSRQWSGFKNPRIVRVSRTFGGKDRHSKVCTIKGLRDRRIRLSVPTAIQLYDLQDRLGLSQPSKVIDWLLDTTKHDIDKLPPLPILPGGFNPFHPGGATHSGGNTTSSLQGYHHGLLGQSSSSSPFLDANLLSSRRELGININSQSMDVEDEDQDEDEDDDQSLVAKLKYWDPNVVMRSKQKGGVDATSTSSQQQISAQNFFPINASHGNINTSSILPPNSSLLSSNNPMLNYYHWEPSNLSLTQFGSTHGLASQNDHDQQSNSNPPSLPSSLSLSSSGSQLFLYPSMATTPLLFPPHPHASFINSASHHQLEAHDVRQLSRFHPLSNSLSSSLQNSSGLGLRPFPLSMSHHHNQSSHLQQNDHDSHEDKGGGGDHGS